MKNIAIALAALATLILSGCAQLPLPEPTATTDNIQQLKKQPLKPMAVGGFTAPADKAKMDKSINVRTNSVKSPYGSSFAAYLKQTLITELKAANILNADSDIVVSAVLEDSELRVPNTRARGKITAHFKVHKAGNLVYDKSLSVSNDWKSNFVGAIAIPTAINEYSALYPKLVNKLLSDADFIAVTQ